MDMTRYARLSEDILPYPQINEGQLEGGKRKAGCADLRVNKAALPALQAGAADRAKPTFLRYVAASLVTPIWVVALPVAFFLLVGLFLLSPALLVPSCFSPKCKELFNLIADNSFKAFRTITSLLAIIAGEEVDEDVFFREAPNAAARNVEHPPIEEEENPLLIRELEKEGQQ